MKTEQEDKKSTNKKSTNKKLKLVGVVKRTFKVKDVFYGIGSDFTTTDKGSFDYMINSGRIVAKN